MADYWVDGSIGADQGTGADYANRWGRATGSVIAYALTQIGAGAATGDNIHVVASDNLGGTDLSLGTYAPTADKVLSIVGATSSAFDGGRAAINLGGASTFIPAATNGVHFQDLDISGGTSSWQISGNDDISVFRCKIDGGATTGGITIDGAGSVSECYVYNLSGSGIFSDSTVNNCYVVQASASGGIETSGTSLWVYSNLIVLSATGAWGIQAQVDNPTIRNNTIYNSTAGTAQGILIGTTIESGVIENNYCEGFNGTGGDAIQIGAGSILNRVVGNRWKTCTNGITVSGRIVFSSDNSETTSSGLVAAGSADYRPTSELISAGVPTGFLGLAGNAMEIDVGAIQKVPAAGGGLLTHPGMKGRING